MAKEMSCFNYFPGDITEINGRTIDNFLIRDGRKAKLINGIWLGGPGDNQRQTEFHYIYADDNLLGGK